MHLDRPLQKQILAQLKASYPDGTRDFSKTIPVGQEDHWISNMVYLESHDLIVASISNFLGGGRAIGSPKITARGLDFLEDDGGLSAILGTVTVKLHADTVRALLESRIDEEDIPAAEKGKLKSALQGLPASALQEVTKQLIQAGIHHFPSLDSLRSLVGL